MMRCLETFQAKKFTLSFRESLHIEKEQLNFYQSSHSKLSPHSSPPDSSKQPSFPMSHSSYSFDFSKPTTRWALAEVAKAVQHIANISCLPKEEMQVGSSSFYIHYFSVVMELLDVFFYD